MAIIKHLSIMRLGAVALMAAALTACGGGGGGGGGGGNPPPPPVTGGVALNAVNNNGTGPIADTSNTNIGPQGSVVAPSGAAAAFSALDNANWHAVTVNSPPIIRFTVVSNGQFVTTLTKSSVRFAMNQLVTSRPAKVTDSGSVPDQWVPFVYHSVTSAAAVAAFPVPADAKDWQATTESPTGDLSTPACQGLTDATGVGTGCLVYDSTNHFYTFYMRSDVKKVLTPTALGTTLGTAAAATPAGAPTSAADGDVGTLWNPAATHRVAIQMSFTDSDGNTQLVNPWYDFTIDAATGNSVPVTDLTKDHIVVNIASCNTCHSKLAMHGGGRIDTQFCVMCHNGTTVDPYSGNNLDLRTMVHNIHAGRSLIGGYKIVGYQNSVSDFSNVGFPQDLRNCTKCHSGDAAVAGRMDAATGGPDGTVAKVATPQGENWNTQVSKAACLTCHTTGANDPRTTLIGAASGLAGQSKNWADIHPFGLVADAVCATCHAPGTGIEPAVGHYVQQITNGRNYKYNLISAKVTTAPTTLATGTVTAVFNIAYTNPTTKAVSFINTATDPRTAGSFVKLALGYYNLNSKNASGNAVTLADFTNYNNGGSASANASTAVCTTTVSANDTCTVAITLPMNTAARVAQGGTAEVLMYGTVKETQLETDGATALPAAPLNAFTLGVHPEALPFAISGTASARRTIVADYKCDSCHGVLDTTSGSNTLSIAFHSGDRGSVKACPICHDVNRLSTSELQPNGSFYGGVVYNESFAFRRFVHGIHSAGAGFRAMPFLHGNATTSVQQGPNPANMYSGNNYAQIVTYPGALDDCSQCHMVPGDSGNTRNTYTFQADANPLGVAVNQCGTDWNPALIGGPAATTINAAAFNSIGIAGYNRNTCTAATKGTNPLNWNVITPQASACSACHDGTGAANHMINVGGAHFGTMIGANLPGSEIGMVLANDGTFTGPAALSWDTVTGTQGAVVNSAGSIQGTVFEACDGCHGNTSNGAIGITGVRVQDVHKAVEYQFPDTEDLAP